jgi:hypothetical protein
MTILNYVYILLCFLVLTYLFFYLFFFSSMTLFIRQFFLTSFFFLQAFFLFLVITSLLNNPYFTYSFQLPTLLETFSFTSVRLTLHTP